MAAGKEGGREPTRDFRIRRKEGSEGRIPGVGYVVGEGVAVGTAVGVAVRYLAVTTVEVTSPQPLSPETPSMPKLNSANVGFVVTLLLSVSYPLFIKG